MPFQELKYFIDAESDKVTSPRGMMTVEQRRHQLLTLLNNIFANKEGDKNVSEINSTIIANIYVSSI